MLCCFDSFADPQSAYANTTSYPGQRKDYIKTNGNALAAAPGVGITSQNVQSGTENNMISVTVPEGVSPGQTIHVASPNGSGQLIQAVVPVGMVPGKTFIVTAPPSGPMMPPPMNLPQSSMTTAPPVPVPIPAPVPVPAPAPHVPTYEKVEYPVAEPVDDCLNDQPGSPPPFSESLDRTPFSQALNNHAPMAAAAPINESVPVPQPSGNGKALLQVDVPPGVRPGSMIHVQVPDEDRIISARVPPNCTVFNVEYEPRPKPSAYNPPYAPHTSSSPPFSAVLDGNNQQSTYETSGHSFSSGLNGNNGFNQAASPPPFSSVLNNNNYNSHSHHNQTSSLPPFSASLHGSNNYSHTSSYNNPDLPSAPPGHKLVLVQVPPGAPAGSMLHVQIPGEPGRLVQAPIPHGGVTQFHVAYRPRGSSHSQSSGHHGGAHSSQSTLNNGQYGYRPSSGGYGGNNYGSQSNNGNSSGLGGLYQADAYGNNNNGHNSQGNQSNNGGGLGGLFPAVGGFAAGAAVAMVAEHLVGGGGD